MFELPENPALNDDADSEAVVLVHLNFRNPGYEDAQHEFMELVKSTGGRVAEVIEGKRYKPDPKYFCGSGKAEQIAETVSQHHAGLVIFNHELSPSQERNLEQKMKCRVLGRTGLILDIFARRARSHEGKLQVELAQLKHMSTRLVRGWTHLERQKGGIGLRGPGETQLETDRRLLAQRIKNLKKRLDKVRSQRNQGRRSRQRGGVPVVSLVGYTNVGKSTLFNKLTSAEVYADDRLFATLDPTLRRIRLPETETIVMADTVGFIRQLPHDLVESFSSTLEETRDAELLLHVVDATAPDRDDLIVQVDQVLEQIGADDVPQIMVLNKIDRDASLEPRVERDENGNIRRVWVSAQTGAGLEHIRDILRELFPAPELAE